MMIWKENLVLDSIEAFNSSTVVHEVASIISCDGFSGWHVDYCCFQMLVS